MEDDFIIAIPTKGRVENQITLKSIPFYYHPNVYFVVPYEERNDHGGRKNVIRTPPSVKDIGSTRAWILSKMKGVVDFRYVLMLDDDMDICYRPKMQETRLITIHSYRHFHSNFDKLYRTLYDWMKSGIIHVGISARQGNNHLYEPYRDASRMMNAYAYDAVALNKTDVKLNRLPVMEDFDLTLQLLRRGFINRVSYQWCWNQRGSNSTGGCSTYRTGAVQKVAATKLHEYHPDFVKVVTKTSKSRWEGLAERTDVNIQWRKAYESANHYHK